MSTTKGVEAGKGGRDLKPTKARHKHNFQTEEAEEEKRKKKKKRKKRGDDWVK